MPRKHPRLKPYTDDPDSKNQRNVLPKEQPKITAMFRKLDRSGGTRGRPKGSKNKKGKKKKNAGAPRSHDGHCDSGASVFHQAESEAD